MTNKFPEITGRVCPALCESACTLSINDEPVLIRHIELQIVERGFKAGWIKPVKPPVSTGIEAGKDISAGYLHRMFDCICLATGAEKPRDLNVPGRELAGVVFAVDY